MRRSLKYIFLFLFIFATLCLQSAVAQASTIENIRFGQPKSDTYRIVIELSQDTDFTSFLLQSPRRLVIDIPQADWQAPDFSPYKNIPITAYRYGTPESGTGRIVFDLNAPIMIQKAFALPRAQYKKKDRIVIDIKTVANTLFENTLDTAWARERSKDNTAYTIPRRRLAADQPPPSHYALPPAAETKPLSRRVLSKEEKVHRLTRAFTQRHSGQPVDDTTANTTLPLPVKSEIILTQDYTPTTPRPVKKPYQRTSPLRKRVIAIDAGHGGHDPGAVNGKIYEKHITLSLARELKKQMEATGRYKVILTRNSDKLIKLRQRVNIARKGKAELFVSLHADKIERTKLRGASVYTLSEKSSDKETAKLARNANQSDTIAGVDLSKETKDVVNILIDLAMRDTMNNSNILANTLVKHFRNDGIKLINRAHRSAGFAVLKAPDIPSVLIEAGFISNRQEAMQLSSKSYQRKLAQSILSGIDDFFRSLESVTLH